MGALAHLDRFSDAGGPRSPAARQPRLEETALDVVVRLLRAGAHERAHPVIDAAHAQALLLAEGGGRSTASAALAATAAVTSVLTELAARGDLDEADTRVAVETLADVLDVPIETASFAVYERAVTSPDLLELPPTTAAAIQLMLLQHLSAVDGLSVWQLDGASLTPMLSLGADLPHARARAAARSVTRERAPLFSVGPRGLRAVPIRRFATTVGALVAQPRGGDPARLGAFLETAARALGPVLERELLLDRGATRERELTQALEKRLMRVGFDLHDGPIQDVLALGAELGVLGQDVYPFVLETHRGLAAGRFDDLVARVSEIDGALREIAHGLESRSVISRPLGETLHRMTDEFSRRSGIEATLEISGDPESLTAAQRIAVFRAIQESLTNVREHAGAESVTVVLRARRSSIDVRVTDDGLGFDVERALARAAQRGRLGLVGMGERVRLLGGTFDIESRPGGPTVVRFTLPRTAPA
jgi:signal transduction histidine kinase